MAFSGGVYTLPGPALNTGDTVSATENNNFRNDVAGAFNDTWLRDGTANPTANIPMDGFKLTGLAAGTTNGDSVRYEQLTAATSGMVTETGTQTLTNKTISAADNTLTGVATLTGTQTLTNKTFTGYTETVYTITDGAAFEINPANGTIQLITLGASRTPKATSFAAGQSVTLMVDDGTAYTITWTDSTFGGSGVVWKTDGGTAPTLNTSGYTVIVLWKAGTQVYGARVGNA